MKLRLKICFAVISTLLIAMFLISSCSSNLTEKEEIIKVFNKNEDKITNAVKSGDFDKVEKIRGIRSVYVFDEYIDFNCGSFGLAPSSQSYGFFYSADDDLTAWNGICKAEHLIEYGDGYKYQNPNGNNEYEYYVEKIGEHFFYYEAHF